MDDLNDAACGLDVHIVRFKLRRHKRPKDDEPCQLPRMVCQSLNVGQPSRDQAPLQSTGPEMCDHLGKGGLVNPYRQVTIAVKVWPLSYREKASYTLGLLYLWLCGS